MTTAILCNHKRCRKPAAYGFRPYKDGWDMTATLGKQYRCEQHGSWLLIDGEIRTTYTWRIEQPKEA